MEWRPPATGPARRDVRDPRALPSRPILCLGHYIRGHSPGTVGSSPSGFELCKTCRRLVLLHRPTDIRSWGLAGLRATILFRLAPLPGCPGPTRFWPRGQRPCPGQEAALRVPQDLQHVHDGAVDPPTRAGLGRVHQRGGAWSTRCLPRACGTASSTCANGLQAHTISCLDGAGMLLTFPTVRIQCGDIGRIL